MRGAPRTLKVGIRRVFGERGYESAQTWYWKIRTRILSYDFSFRDDLEQLVRPGDTVVDVGANVGQYTALFSRLVGSTGRVIAIEPAARAYRILQHTAAANVETINAAVAAHPGVAAIHEPADQDGLPNIGLAHLIDGDTVPVTRLDDLTLPSCALVKIDVEGAELAVLQGAEQFIRQHRPLLLVDTCPDRAHTFLARLGYQAWRQDGLVVLFRRLGR